MVWTTPKTWNSGDVLSSVDLNTHIRDNLSALKSPPSGEYTCNETSDYTTTATTFAAVDGTNLTHTITTTGGDVIVHFHGNGDTNGNAQFGSYDFTVDGVLFAGDDGIVKLRQETTSAARAIFPIGFTALVTGLAAGEHTFTLQWKAGTSSLIRLYAGAGTTNNDQHPQFWVREVS